MKKNEKDTARRVQTAALCCCLCLLAVGVGVTYRAFEGEEVKPLKQETEAERPVTVMNTPTIEVAQLERDKQSNDPAEAPEEEKPEAEKKTKEKQEFVYPLKGELLLPYSTEHAVFDPTLEQYRTNASISISAAQGDAVQAAADGTVKEIKKDTEAGNVVILSHGEGWETSYGQLEGALQVKEGERVVQGQTIGTVALPTKYGAALGTHLEFAMEQEGEPKDPVLHLKKVE